MCSDLDRLVTLLYPADRVATSQRQQRQEVRHKDVACVSCRTRVVVLRTKKVFCKKYLEKLKKESATDGVWKWQKVQQMMLRVRW